MDDQCKRHENERVDKTINQIILLSNDSKVPMVKWLYCLMEEEHSNEVWKCDQYNAEIRECQCKKKSKKKYKSRKQPSERSKTGDLYHFFKVIKKNALKSCRPKVAACKCCYVSVEPTFVLANCSAKLVQCEKKLKQFDCSKDDKYFIKCLIADAQRLIIIQFKRGPCANDLLVKSVRDVFIIDCLMNKLEQRLQNENNLKLNEEEVMFDKEKDKDMRWDDVECDETKKTSDGNIKSYCFQVNRQTSTSNTDFNGELDPNAPKLKNKFCQTDKYKSYNNGTYEFTTMCINYSKQNFVNELDELPNLTNIEREYYAEIDLDKEISDTKKTYMTRIDDFNVLAETNTKSNHEELNVIFNNELCKTYKTTGNLEIAEEHARNLKRDLTYYAGKIATHFINAKNYFTGDQETK